MGGAGMEKRGAGCGQKRNVSPPTKVKCDIIVS